MKENLFVTGTDTNIGKTLLSALLVAALDGIYWKPIQTGASEGTDRETVMRWAEIPAERTIPECYCFDPPVSPHLAAEWSGVTIGLDKIARPSRRTSSSRGPLIVEGAGGIRVPINDRESMLDLARHIGAPVLVAARSALGTINHTTLTVDALRAAGTNVLGVVTIGNDNKDNERAIERFAKTPVIGRIPMLEKIHRAALLQTFDSFFDRKYFES